MWRVHSPFLTLGLEISTQLIRTNFLAYCFSRSKYSFVHIFVLQTLCEQSKGKVILKNSGF